MKKGNNNYNLLMMAIIFFYIVLSVFMIIVGNIVLLKNSQDLVDNHIYTGGINYYLITVIIIGILMLVGSVSGLVGLIGKNMSNLLFSVIIVVMAHFLFVVMDSYYSIIYQLFDGWAFSINLLSLLSGICLAVLGYRKQTKNK